MRAKTRLGPGVWATLQAQAGVISRSQLAELGVGRRVRDRLAAEGTVRVVTTGVLSFGGDPGWFGRAWAGLLVGGPEAVLGLDSAGHLHGLIREPPDEITVFVGRRRWPTARPGYRFIRALRAPGHTEPARTGVEATLLDLCAAADEDEVAALLADAVSSRRTTAERLLKALAVRPRHPRRPLIRDMLGEVRRGVHSALEHRFLIAVERPHGLSEATRQARTHEKHRGDVWYGDYDVLVELDSRMHHTGGAAFRDMTRDNDHALRGVVTLRVGWDHVTGVMQCDTALVLGRILMSRGWEGPITPCDRCRLVHRV